MDAMQLPVFNQIRWHWLAIKSRMKFGGRRHRRIRRHLDEIRRGEGEIRRDYDWIPLYFRYQQTDESNTPGIFDAVDDRTWADLEMNQVFARLDRTVSVIGRQYLYAMLRIYQNDADQEPQRLNALYRLFETDAAFREKIQMALYPLRRDENAWIATLLYEALPPKPKFFPFIYLSAGLFFLALVLSFVNPVFIFAVVGMAFCNMIINAFYGPAIFRHCADLAPFATMLNAVGKLASIASPIPVRELDTLRERKDFAARLNKKVFWLCLNEDRTTSDLAAAVYGFLNHFGLSRLIAFLRVIDDLQKSKDEICQIFEAIGSLDACIAVASWRQGVSASAVPSFNESGIIDVEGLRHPLIENAVGNSIFLRGESALITGSNMAGKTSFIKTVGINMILAQTIFVTLAERADFPRYIVRTSIQRDEQVLDGRSYYFREIELLREFLNCPENRYLFLIDEILRGTNTVERVAISASILRHLASRNMALVTTHDVELQPLLSDCARLFHFSEQVEGDRYYFDFVLRDGPCRAGNAIRLIELKGYPSDIVTEARHLAGNRLNAP
jgi:hypothetical protein